METILIAQTKNTNWESEVHKVLPTSRNESLCLKYYNMQKWYPWLLMTLGYSRPNSEIVLEIVFTSTIKKAKFKEVGEHKKLEYSILVKVRKYRTDAKL